MITYRITIERTDSTGKKFTQVHTVTQSEECGPYRADKTVETTEGTDLEFFDFVSMTGECDDALGVLASSLGSAECRAEILEPEEPAPTGIEGVTLAKSYSA